MKRLRSKSHMIAIIWVSICVMVTQQAFLLPCSTTAYAETEMASVSGLDTAEENRTTNAAYLEHGAIYAMKNKSSSKWASTATTAATQNSHNLFQHTTWNSAAQTFQFVGTGEENVYIIYPLEINRNNQNRSRALFCNYSPSSTSALNVYPVPYDEERAECFEWLVEQIDEHVYTICLRAQPNYKMVCYNSSTGTVAGTQVTADGNIIARYSTSTVIRDVQKWEFTYVIPNGTYYIKNSNNNQYLSSGGTAGTAVYTSSNKQEALQKWTIHHAANGYYFISLSGVTLSLSSSAPNNGECVYVEPNMAQPRFQWKIVKNAGGSFRFINAYSESYDYMMKVSSSSLTPYAVINGTSTGSEYEEWYFENVASLIGIRENPAYHDHWSCYDDIQLSLRVEGFDPDVYVANYISNGDCTSYLDESSIFVSRSHGKSASDCTYIQLYYSPDEADSVFSRYSSHMVYDYDNNVPKYDLSNLEIALFVGCKTANHSTKSLPQAVVDCGAKCAIGFTDSIPCDDANEWTTRFFALYSKTSDIQGICATIASDAGWTDTTTGVGSYRIFTSEGVIMYDPNDTE